jgi:hypothetical protein
MKNMLDQIRALIRLPDLNTLLLSFFGPSENVALAR